MYTLIENQDSKFKGISSRHKPVLLLKEINSLASLSSLAVFFQPLEERLFHVKVNVRFSSETGTLHVKAG